MPYVSPHESRRAYEASQRHQTLELLGVTESDVRLATAIRFWADPPVWLELVPAGNLRMLGNMDFHGLLLLAFPYGPPKSRTDLATWELHAFLVEALAPEELAFLTLAGVYPPPWPWLAAEVQAGKL